MEKDFYRLTRKSNGDGKDVHQVRMIKNIIRRQRRGDDGKLSRLSVWQVE